MKKSLLKLLTCAFSFMLFASFSTVATAQSVLNFENDTVKAGWTFKVNSTTIETPTQLEAKKHAVVSAKADVSAFKLNGTRTTAIADGSRPTFTRLQVIEGNDPVVTWTITQNEGLSFTPTFIKMTIYCDNTDERQDAVVVKVGSTTLGTFTPLRNGKTLADDPLAGPNLTSFIVFELTPEQKTALTTGAPFTMTATMNIPAGRDGGFTDIQVIGVVNGSLEVPAISPEQQDALDDAVAAGNAIKEEYMNSAAKAELNKQLAAAADVDGLDIDAVTDALNAAVAAAQASIAVYEPFVTAVTDAEATLAAASEEADGYTAFQSAVITARTALNNGTPSDPTSNINALNLATNTFVVAGASVDTPKDATSFIVNPTFADTLGWTITNPNPANVTVSLEAAGTLGFNTTYFKAVDNVVTNGRGLFNKFAVEQTINNIPNGDYYLSADVYFEELANFGRDYLYLYADSKSAQCKRASAEGPATTKVKVRVTGNKLTIKLTSTADRNNIIAFSNFKLEYMNFESWANVNYDEAANTATVAIASYEELIDAFRYDYAAGADVTITMANGTYELGTGSRKMPSNRGKLTIKAADGASPVVHGALISTTGNAKMQEIVVEGITFNTETGETGAPYVSQGGDSIGAIIFRNNTFTEMGAPLVRLRNNAYLGTLTYEGNTISNLLGNNHVFIANNTSQILENFNLIENKIINYGGKQFMQFANLKNPADSTLNVRVINNLFYNFKSADGSNAKNFIEGAKTSYLNIAINNNFFYYDSIPAGMASPILVNPGGTYKDYTLNMDGNVYNNWDGALIDNIGVLGDYEPAIVKEDLEYTYGKLILKSDPLYTAGTNQMYVGPVDIYYSFDVEAQDHFIVDNLTAFRQALTYENAGDTVLIELKNNTDELGFYEMGANANKLTAKKSLTIRAYAGNTPKVHGTVLRAGGAANLDEAIIENIAFVGNGAVNENAAPINTDGNDHYETVIFRNNTFTNWLDPLARLRGGNAYVGHLIYEGNVITNLGDNSLGTSNQHTFILNQASHILKNFTLKENKFIDPAQKQFMQFANVKNPEDSTLNINVINNLFYNFKSADGSNAKNFIEGAKTAYLNLNVNNNFFYYDSIPDGSSVPVLINPGGSYKEGAYKLNIDGNVYNNWDGALIDNVGILGAEDPAVVIEDLQYAYGDKFFTNSPLYTAGVAGAYVGTPDLYYSFKAEGDTENLTLTVYDSQELIDALAANYAGYANITIELAADSFGLGERVGRPMPKFGGNLTIKAANGFSPKVGGSFRSNGSMNVNNYVFDGLTFVTATSGANTDSSPIFINKGSKDNISGTLEIKNCTFLDMQACIIRINANNTENNVHAVNIHHNLFDGINHHFFQFAGGKDFGVTSFSFTENVVKNYKAPSAQFFNTPLPTNPPAGSDSTYTMTVEHNTFYKIGGQANALRHFIECNKDNNFKKVTMNFNNNIFWENYSLDGMLNCDLALFNANEGQEVEVNVLNNLLYPETVMTNMFDPDYVEGTVANFPVTSGNITPNFKHIYLADLAADTTTFWASEELLKIFDNTAAFTAGIDGTYLGAKVCYVKGIEVPKRAIYFWASSEGVVVEKGGTSAIAAEPVRINYPNAGHYTICLNGKKDFSDKFVELTLDEAVVAGDVIKVTAYRNKGDDSKTSGALFSAGDKQWNTGDGKEFIDIAGDATVAPNTVTVVVPEGVNTKSIKITRSNTGTNLFITELAIIHTPKGAKVAYLGGVNVDAEGNCSEAIFNALDAADMNVTAMNYDGVTLTDEMVAADFAGYDAVVIAGRTGSSDNLAKSFDKLVGKVNVLSTKSFWYQAPGNGGTKGTNPGAADAPSTAIDTKYAEHPLFAGLDATKSIVVFNENAEITNGRYMQGNGTFGTVNGNAIEQTTVATTKAVDAIGEAWVNGKGWMIIPFDGSPANTAAGALTADGEKLFVNAVNYLVAGVPYVLPSAINSVKINGVYANNGTIYLNLNEDSNVIVYDVLGKAVKNIDAKAGLNTIEGLNAGQVYIVRTASEIVKVIL